MRLQIICRETEAQALAAAEKLIHNVPEAARERLKQAPTSQANRRVQLVEEGYGLRHIYDGLTRFRRGAGIAVWQSTTVADTLQVHIDAGLSLIVCLSKDSAEAERFGRLVQPMMARNPAVSRTPSGMHNHLSWGSAASRRGRRGISAPADDRTAFTSKDERRHAHKTCVTGSRVEALGVNPSRWRRSQLGSLVDLYQWDMDNPALLFDHIRGINRAILANVLPQCRVVSASYTNGVERLRPERGASAQTLKQIPAELVRTAPSSTTNRLAIKSILHSFAPLYAAMVDVRHRRSSSRDPDTSWISCGTYRSPSTRPKDRRHHDLARQTRALFETKYWSRGEACPVAISMGHDPLLLLMGGL